MVIDWKNQYDKYVTSLQIDLLLQYNLNKNIKFFVCFFFMMVGTGF